MYSGIKAAKAGYNKFSISNTFSNLSWIRLKNYESYKIMLRIN